MVDSSQFNGKAHSMFIDYLAKVKMEAVGGDAKMPSRNAPVDR
jgi:hypothetical protein